MAAYNAEGFIERSIRSVLDQRYPHLELIIVNDGSRDLTASIVERLTAEDTRIRFIQQPNGGPAAARNRGIQQARGEYVANLDSDDLWHPDFLDRAVRQFERLDPQVGLLYAWSVDIDAQDRLIGDFRASQIWGEVYQTLLCHNFLRTGSAALVRRQYLQRIGGYDEALPPGCEDWDFYLRLAEQCHFQPVPAFLIGYRKLTVSVSHNCNAMAYSYETMIDKMRHLQSKTPGWLYRLSSSSFYLYLARQSQVGQAQPNLKWGAKALRAAPWSVLRPGPYGFVWRWLLRRNRLVPRQTALQPEPATGRPLFASQAVPFDSLSVQRMIWIDASLHRVMRRR